MNIITNLKMCSHYAQRTYSPRFSTDNLLKLPQSREISIRLSDINYNTRTACDLHNWNDRILIHPHSYDYEIHLATIRVIKLRRGSNPRGRTKVRNVSLIKHVFVQELVSWIFTRKVILLNTVLWKYKRFYKALQGNLLQTTFIKL
mgnify:FL=1